MKIHSEYGDEPLLSKTGFQIGMTLSHPKV